VRAHAKVVGGQRSRVSAADDDDTSGLFGHCCLLVLIELAPLRHRRLAGRDNLGENVSCLTLLALTRPLLPAVFSAAAVERENSAIARAVLAVQKIAG